MKQKILGLVLLGLILIGPPEAAGSLRCGLKPLPPIGCDYICVCEHGECRWVQVCD